jgi:hypothetical protein
MGWPFCFFNYINSKGLTRVKQVSTLEIHNGSDGIGYRRLILSSKFIW